MLMSRRSPASWRESARLALWPRRTWARSARYALLRITRLKVLPQALAAGIAAGVFVAMLPIPGLQLITAAGLAWVLRGHRGIAALATFAANPVTYPLIWIASYMIGATILGTPLSNASHDFDAISGAVTQAWAPGVPAATIFTSMRSVLPIMATLAIGALPLALASATLAYLATRHFLRHRDNPPDAVPAGWHVRIAWYGRWRLPLAPAGTGHEPEHLLPFWGSDYSG